ncbi:MAG: alpha/beta hydrolase fold domain-containing protein [Alphaproteobacteria bacterium]|nr:alpha/beta hydrolase fold domain-containing protein [Alphaproteobacteria bacterium]
MPDSVAMHPEMQVLVDSKAGLPPATTLEEMRAGWNLYSVRMRRPHPEDMTVADDKVAGKGGAIPIRIYRPAAAAAKAPCVLYFHGGGFMKGDLDSSDTTAWGLAQETGAVVVSVDYRLAPENPYPAAFDDCFSVLADVAGNAGRYGVDPARIAVSGDSAGGNLAAAVSLAARDRDGPAVAAQVLIYPCLTDDTKHESYRVHAVTPGLTAASMGSYWNWYLAGSAQPVGDPYALPLKARSLAGLPRALVHVAEIDPLYDDGRLYAERLKAAGVPTEYRCAKGMIHGFMRARLLGPDSAAEFGAICGFLRRSLA